MNQGAAMASSRVWGLGFRDLFRVWGLGFIGIYLGFRASRLGIRVPSRVL